MARAKAAASVSNPVKAAVRKKPLTAKSTRKPAAKKSAPKSSGKAREALKSVADKLSQVKVPAPMKEVAYAQLGFAGKVFDGVNERVTKARQDAPKQWGKLVKRGEQVQRDLEKAQKDLARELKTRAGKIDIKADIESRVEQVRDAVAKIKARVSKTA